MVRPELAGLGVVDIFDEVSADLRADRARALLKRYAVLLVVAVVLVVAGVAGWQAWRWRSEQRAAETAMQFLGAVQQASAVSGAAGGAAAGGAAREQALAGLAAVAAEGGEGYRTLARLREAALRVSGNDVPGALALWDKVSADTGADPLLRGLADLLWVQHQVDGGDPAAVEGRLAGLVAAGNPWRVLALESQAWLAIRTGQAGRAREILRGLRADTQAPDGVRARAGGLLSQLGEEAPGAVPGAVPAGAGG